MITDKTGVKAKDPGRSHDFSGSVTAEGAHHMNHKGCLEHSKVVGNCWTTHFTGTCKPRCFEDPSALSQQQLYKSLEGIAPLQAKQFLDVFCPVSVDPLLEISFRELLSYEKWRKTSPQEAVH